MFQHFLTQRNNQSIQPGAYVLYWMQSSQRTEWNLALEYAVRQANKMNQPLLVYFGLTQYPEANLRHYHFMLEGLKEVETSLAARGIKFILILKSPEQGVLEYAKDASLCVVDVGYLRTEQDWRNDAARNMRCPLIQVESNVIVPVRIASQKEEYAAFTFRPKILKQLNKFLQPLSQTEPNVPSTNRQWSTQLELEKPKEIISQLSLEVNVKPVPYLHGGTSTAKRHLKNFIDTRLDDYHLLRNDPYRKIQSNMSPYLHFGQISPLFIALQIQATKSPGKAAYLEELIVRRELSINYIHYNQQYKALQGLPQWAQRTLRDHCTDPREYNYPIDAFEQAKTHDPYWNAAQRETVVTGKMHGYMRMYWGKKILEWSKTPEQAFATALYLNNKYELDGRDPNSYTGIAWCFGKHDRPWKERPIFGKIRYMNDQGLQRKFDIDRYVQQINQLS
jgi:deoxyribodipyrimidine photo-lyase